MPSRPAKMGQPFFCLAQRRREFFWRGRDGAANGGGNHKERKESQKGAKDFWGGGGIATSHVPALTSHVYRLTPKTRRVFSHKERKENKGWGWERRNACRRDAGAPIPFIALIVSIAFATLPTPPSPPPGALARRRRPCQNLQNRQLSWRFYCKIADRLGDLSLTNARGE